VSFPFGPFPSGFTTSLAPCSAYVSARESNSARVVVRGMRGHGRLYGFPDLYIRTESGGELMYMEYGLTVERPNTVLVPIVT
jgi:hypothetical protein